MDSQSTPDVNAKVESSTETVNRRKSTPNNNNNQNQRRGGWQGGRNSHPGASNPRKRHTFQGRQQNNDDPSSQGKRQHDRFLEKLESLSGPTFDLPPLENTEKKFGGRNRLYIGNIGIEIKEDDINELLQPFGEVSEIFLNNEKNFAFAKLDYHSNAEKAKKELDGTVFKMRNIKIRIAPSTTTIKVKNLSSLVTNELLFHAFSIFGEIEHAIIIVDDRGKSTGEGLIDFIRKGCALAAIEKCTNGCFFLTGSLRPCIVEQYDSSFDIDGLSEKNVNKRNPQYQKEREEGPSFATPGSFKYEYGMRWKDLYSMFEEKEKLLKKQFEFEKEKLTAQMEFAKFDHETEMLREQLRARELDKERQKREFELMERQAEEYQRNNEFSRNYQYGEEEALRRQQEEQLFRQAHSLNNLLSQQIDDDKSSLGNSSVTDPKTFIMSSYTADGVGNKDSMPPMEDRGYWANQDKFALKRRRF